MSNARAGAVAELATAAAADLPGGADHHGKLTNTKNTGANGCG